MLIGAQLCILLLSTNIPPPIYVSNTTPIERRRMHVDRCTSMHPPSLDEQSSSHLRVEYRLHREEENAHSSRGGGRERSDLAMKVQRLRRHNSGLSFQDQVSSARLRELKRR